MKLSIIVTDRWKWRINERPIRLNFISFLQSHILWIFCRSQKGCPSDKNPHLHCNYFLIPQLASSWNRIIWDIKVKTKSQSNCTVIIKFITKGTTWCAPASSQRLGSTTTPSGSWTWTLWAGSSWSSTAASTSSSTAGAASSSKQSLSPLWPRMRWTIRFVIQFF